MTFNFLNSKPVHFIMKIYLFIQKFKVIPNQVLNNFFSASDIMEAVKGCFYYYGMNAIYLITIPVELGFLGDFELKIC